MEMKDRIKAVRRDAGITQQQMAEDLGVSKSSIMSWEYDQNKPSKAVLQLISQKYNINPMYLDGESDIMHIPPDEDE